MKQTRAIAFAILTGLTLVTTGCAVMRGQTDVGTYVDDRTITTAVKAKLIEETVLRLTFPVVANQEAGEALLGKRKDLKTLLGDILKEGVEYLYTPADIRWRWSLERTNWSTVSGGDLPHHVVFTPEFTDNCIGVELGPGGKRKKTKKG